MLETLRALRVWTLALCVVFQSLQVEGNLYLIAAAESGKAHKIKVLVKHGHDINVVNSEGQTPLQVAAATSTWKAVAIHSVKELIHLGAELDVRDNEGETALHKAANSFLGHVHAVQALINAGAKLDIVNNQGKTALHLAASQGNADAVQALMDAGAKLDLRDIQGETALHKATWAANALIAEKLLFAGANRDFHNVRGQTALMVASYHGYTGVAKVLIELGAHLDLQDVRGDAALHQAARWGFVDIIRVLADGGADLNLQNNEGKTAGFVAVEVEKVPSIQALVAYSYDWTNVADNAHRLPWDLTSNQAILQVLPPPSWWHRWYNILHCQEFFVAVCCALAAGFPLAQMLVLYVEESRHKERHKSSSSEPSPGAQHLASAVLLGNRSSIFPAALLFRAFEVWSATMLLAWSFGCMIQPSLSALVLMVVYVLPSTLIVGYKPALQCPALCIASATRSVAVYPLSALDRYFVLAVLRFAALLLVPCLVTAFLASPPDSSLHYFGLSLTNSDLAGPFLNLRKLASENVGALCFLNPGIGLAATELQQCSLNFHLWHVVLPWTLVLLAAAAEGYRWYASGFRVCCQDMEAKTEPARQLQERIRSLALDFDEVAKKAPSNELNVWKTVGIVIDSKKEGLSTLATPASRETFWKSPYFDVGMLAADMLSDIYMLQNIFFHRCWCCGGFLLAVLAFAISAEVMTGTTPRSLLHEAKESERLGFRSARFKAMQQHEAAWEALPSLAISSFAFWFTVNQWDQLLFASCSLLLSLYSVARFLHEKLDLQVPADDGSCEEQRQLFGATVE